MSKRTTLCGLATLIALPACQRLPHKAPPRASDAINVPIQTSTIAVPVSADLSELSAALERAVPRKLWAIDKPDQVCVPAGSKLAGIKLPAIKCHLIGEVDRGPLALSGAGRDIVVAMPLQAAITAQDIGGIVKQKTAHAEAIAHARIRLDVTRDWSLTGRVTISYDWTDVPHVDLLGQRIEFTSKADDKLAGVIRQLQRTLPGELAKLHFRDRVGDAWRTAFTSIQLNEANPPVWMRIRPQQLSYGGYRIANHRLTLDLGLKAATETFVGQRPADPVPTPLPPLDRTVATSSGIAFAIPVIADYPELEPVLAKALAKRSQRPFDVPGLGPIDAHFGRVTVYGTDGGKIAVGLEFSAAKPGGSPSHGTIWLTAKPANAADSRRVSFTDLAVVGVTDSVGASLLIKLANTPGLSSTIADALTQNFSKDYDGLLGKISDAISEKRQGPLLIRAHITQVRTGEIKAAGRGLYLPVWGRGAASIELVRR